MNRQKLIELTNNSSVEDLANIFDEIFNIYDWLMQYTADTLGVEEIEQDDDEGDEEYEAKIAGTPYGICYSFCNKCTPENTAEVVQLAIKNDKVVELWDLFLGEEYLDDFEDFMSTFYRDMHGTQNFTEKQLEIVKEVIDILREV